MYYDLAHYDLIGLRDEMLAMLLLFFESWMLFFFGLLNVGLLPMSV